jgi:hypothetical protein
VAEIHFVERELPLGPYLAFQYNYRMLQPNCYLKNIISGSKRYDICTKSVFCINKEQTIDYYDISNINVWRLVVLGPIMV